jgi:hypothetical protein
LLLEESQPVEVHLPLLRDAFGHDMAGADGVDPDAIRTVLDSELAGETNHGWFDHLVDEPARRDQQPVNGREVDHRPDRSVRTHCLR